MNSKIDVKKTKKRIKRVCAPNKETDPISCFDKETLISMIKKYNDGGGPPTHLKRVGAADGR